MKLTFYKRIPIPTEERLKLSKDRKVTPLGYDGGKRYYGMNNFKHRGMVAKIQNSFGLPAGVSCPGKTEFCKSCYAGRSEGAWPNVDKAMRWNWNQLAKYYETFGVNGYRALLGEAIGRYLKQAEYQGLSDEQRVFRIHWDGDFFSWDYAVAWADVIRGFPNIQFWCYTRSFTSELNVVPLFEGLPNLQLYLSVDEENWSDAIDPIHDHPWLRIAACADDYRHAREMQLAIRTAMPDDLREGALPHWNRMGIACPENAKTIPLISDEGVGACVSCGVCIRGARDILFSTSHLESLDGPQGALFTIPELTGGGETVVRLRTARKSGQLQEGSPDQEEGSPAP